jgi:hypothetical protein
MSFLQKEGAGYFTRPQTNTNQRMIFFRNPQTVSVAPKNSQNWKKAASKLIVVSCCVEDTFQTARTLIDFGKIP